MSEHTWTIEAAIDEGISRIRSEDGETAWFVSSASGDEAAEAGSGEAAGSRLAALADEDGSPEESALDAEARLFPGAEVIVVGGAEGLRVSRCRGGMLTPLLLTGGLSVSEAIGIAAAVLDAIMAAPLPPPGRTRLTRSGLALTAEGEVVVVPGRHARARSPRPEPPVRPVRPQPVVHDPTASVEFAEIVHAAVTGRFWADCGVPVPQTMDGAPRHLIDLVCTLLDGEEIGDLGRLREAIEVLGPEPLRRFAPAEPGVAVDEQPTGVIRADVVAALRGAPVVDERRDAAERFRRSAISSSTGRRGLPRRAQSTRVRPPGSPSRVRAVLDVLAEPKTGILAAAAVSAVVAGGLLVTGSVPSGEASAPSESPAQTAQSEQSEGTEQTDSEEQGARSGHPGETGQAGERAADAGAAGGAAEETTAASPADPARAFEELSEARIAALAAGDGAALAELTVPGSPAAAADERLDLETACPECGGDAGVRSAAAAAAQGDTAVVTAETSLDGEAWTPVRAELRLHDGAWRVWLVGV